MLGHERLDVLAYTAWKNQLSKDLNVSNRNIKDQLIHASQSVPQNIAEGNGKETIPHVKEHSGMRMISLFILFISCFSLASTDAEMGLKFDYMYRGANAFDIGPSLIISFTGSSDYYAFPDFIVSPFAALDMEKISKDFRYGIKTGIDLSTIFAGGRLSCIFFDSKKMGIIAEGGVSVYSFVTIYGGVIYRTFSPLKLQLSVGTNLPFRVMFSYDID